MMPRDGYVTADDGVRLYFQRIGTGGQVSIVPNGPPLFDLLEPFAATHTVVAFDPVIEAGPIASWMPRVSNTSSNGKPTISTPCAAMSAPRTSTCSATPTRAWSSFSMRCAIRST